MAVVRSDLQATTSSRTGFSELSSAGHLPPPPTGRGDVPEPRGDQHQRRVTVRERADNACAAPDLAADPLELISYVLTA